MFFHYKYQALNYNYPSSSTTRSLSVAQTKHIFCLLHSGKSSNQINAFTGVGIAIISRLLSKHQSSLQKSLGVCPTKLSPVNTCHAIHLIHTGQAENAAQVTKPLQDIINQPLSSKTVQHHFNKAGMKAVVKRKRPFLSKQHRRKRLDWAIAHKDWTVEDWKMVIYSDETKINHIGSYGGTIMWKWQESYLG